MTLALNEPSTVNPLDDAGHATGSLLGSLVIVARHRGVQLSKEQLIRDHQLKVGDVSVTKPQTSTAVSANYETRHSCADMASPKK